MNLLSPHCSLLYSSDRGRVVRISRVGRPDGRPCAARRGGGAHRVRRGKHRIVVHHLRHHHVVLALLPVPASVMVRTKLKAKRAKLKTRTRKKWLTLLKTACTEIGGGRGRRLETPFLDFWSTSSALYGTDEGSKDADAVSTSFDPRLRLSEH